MDAYFSVQQLALSLQDSGMRIRRSLRARRLRIIVTPVGGVEVVVPNSVSSCQVQRFIQQKQPWIDETRSTIRALRHEHLDHDLPQTVNLTAVNQVWQVSYVAGNKYGYSEGRDVINQYRLRLTANSDHDAVRLLSAWLSSKAKQILEPWLDHVSDEVGLGFNKVTIRAQKTRWGSCSAKRNINLNRCLVFLEPHLVRYLMIHELCHTRHLNHSKSFWGLVEGFEQNYKECEALLNKACYQLPKWAVAF